MDKPIGIFDTDYTLWVKELVKRYRSSQIKATDIVRAINNEADYMKAGNYWRWLKRKLKQEGIELVSATHGFKFEAPDGKLRVADVLNS